MESSVKIDTIACGDCLDVMADMPSGCADLVVTDPPYNATETRFQGRVITGVGGGDYETINEAWDCGFSPDKVWDELLRISRAGIVFCDYHLLEQWLCLIKSSNTFRQIIHFQKTNPIPNPRKLWNHTILYGLWWAKSPYTFNKEWAGHDILKYSAGHTGIAWHPTVKPLHSFEMLIKVHSNLSDLVFDPFMGSGTTAVAALKLGRHFYGCDINPEYVGLANERIEKAKLQRRLF